MHFKWRKSDAYVAKYWPETKLCSYIIPDLTLSAEPGLPRLQWDIFHSLYLLISSLLSLFLSVTILIRLNNLIVSKSLSSLILNAHILLPTAAGPTRCFFLDIDFQFPRDSLATHHSAAFFPLVQCCDHSCSIWSLTSFHLFNAAITLALSDLSHLSTCSMLRSLLLYLISHIFPLVQCCDHSCSIWSLPSFHLFNAAITLALSDLSHLSTCSMLRSLLLYLISHIFPLVQCCDHSCSIWSLTSFHLFNAAITLALSDLSHISTCSMLRSLLLYLISHIFPLVQCCDHSCSIWSLPSFHLFNAAITLALSDLSHLSTCSMLRSLLLYLISPIFPLVQCCDRSCSIWSVTSFHLFNAAITLALSDLSHLSTCSMLRSLLLYLISPIFPLVQCCDHSCSIWSLTSFHLFNAAITLALSDLSHLSTCSMLRSLLLYLISHIFPLVQCCDHSCSIWSLTSFHLFNAAITLALSDLSHLSTCSMLRSLLLYLISHIFPLVQCCDHSCSIWSLPSFHLFNAAITLALSDLSHLSTCSMLRSLLLYLMSFHLFNAAITLALSDLSHLSTLVQANELDFGSNPDI